MKFKFFIVVSIFIFSNVLWGQDAQMIQPFNSDLCTSSPNGTWGHCCYEHDFLYWAGGSFKERLAADDQLQMCMNKSGGPGEVYREFVRVGGVAHWSSAWDGANRNQNITIAETEIIKSEFELWLSLGSPRNFNFVSTESIVFLPLSLSQKNQINVELQSIRQTSEYKIFLNKYTTATGQLPITESIF